jgi:hypothetical protein
MKKILFIAAIATIALAGCKDKETDAPIVIIKLDGEEKQSISINEGKELKVEIEFTADAGIKQIELTADGNDVDGYPKTGITSKTYNLSFTVGPLFGTKTVLVVTKITDNENRTNEKVITITVVPEPLKSEIGFTLSILGNGINEDNPNMGFRFYGNSVTGLWNIEVVKTNPYNFVLLTANDYSLITSAGLLKYIFENAPEENKRTIITRSVLSTAPIYFISRNGTDYFLIEWTIVMQDGAGIGTAHLKIRSN